MKEEILGDKIKYFRKRAGLSQMDLEVQVGLANGSLSRIENNTINPTKETLSRISSKLNLKPSEIAYLLGLEIYSTEELIDAVDKISKSLDLESTLKTSVDILYDLYPNYNGGIILIRDSKNKNIVRARTISKIPNVEKLSEIMGKALTDFPIDLTSDEENLVIKCMKDQIPYQSTNLYDFGRGAISPLIVEAIERLLGYKVGIVYPMIYNDYVIGSILFTKRLDVLFSEGEIKTLELLVNKVSTLINKYYY